jgi:hypothetical protein
MTADNHHRGRPLDCGCGSTLPGQPPGTTSGGRTDAAPEPYGGGCGRRAAARSNSWNELEWRGCARASSRGRGYGADGRMSRRGGSIGRSGAPA